MAKHKGSFLEEELNNERYRRQHEKGRQRQKLQSASKKLKRNHQPKQARRRDWLPDNPENWDDVDYDQAERIMPRGEHERRRTLEQIVFRSAPAETDEPEPPAPVAASLSGQVVEVSQGRCRVDLGGQTLLCSIRGALVAEEREFTNPVAVGDEVLVSEDGAGGGVVEAVLPRRTMLARPDVFRSHLRQIIVANADQLLIVSSWREPVIWLELIDRYLIAAERNRLPALICINKMDLAADNAEWQAVAQLYRQLGHQVVLTSTVTGQGIDTLRGLLRSRTTILAGLSGVGKSSLLRAVQPGLELRVGAVSEVSGDGRHTTTQATLIRLGPATAVIDTPGIREFGLSGLRQPDLASYFPEIAAMASGCRFNNCLHLAEPECTIQAAAADGRIATSRYHSYRQILASLPA